MRVTLEQALDILRHEGVVAMPTETVYGLAGRIDSEKALHAIFATKQRPFFDPLIVHVASLEEARALSVNWPPVFDILAKRFWPGPLTLISEKTTSVSPLITSGLTTVAVRCPNHPVALELIRRLGTPLAAPSANLFGRTSPTSAEHVLNEFNSQVAVLDGGPCAVGVESTVVRLQDSRLEILRPGGVSRAALSEVLKGIPITRAESSASPGHLKAHYQPVSPVILLEDKIWSPAVQQQVEERLGRSLTGVSPIRLSDNPAQAARQLYEELRRLSRDANHALHITRTAAQRSEIWEAIWDRLERAATLIL